MTEHSADTVELKTCPFCGGDAYTRVVQDEDLSTHNIVDWLFVGCSNCDVSFGIPDGYDCGTAAEQWNTRPALTVEDAAKVLLDADIEKHMEKPAAIFQHFQAWEGYKQGVQDYTSALRAIADTPKEGE